MRTSTVSLGFAALLASAAGLGAQTPGVRMSAPPPPPPGAPAANPAMEEAQRAFDSLPEPTRRAIQNDLIWASTFTATVSGSFGPRTYDAIRKFQTDMRLKADGILAPDAMKMLSDVANRARATARYAAVTDPRTGARLGIPGTVLSRMEPAPGGTRWLSADGAVVLETAAAQGAAADLPAAFERVLGIPGRKVTYKLLREDFFVVAGESGPRSFYTRYGLGPSNLRGYTITYPTPQAKALERTVIALANSFQPAPGAAPAAGQAAAPQQQTAVPPAQQQAAPAADMLPAGLIATGVVVAPGKVATAGTVAACPDLRIRGQQARVARSAGGVTLIDADTGPARALSAGLAGMDAAKDAQLVVIGFVGGARAPQMMVSTGLLMPATDPARPARIEAPVHREAAGSLVFTRQGALLGAIATPRATPRLVAGIVPAASHALVEGKALVPEAAADAAGRSLTAGEIAARFGGALVPVECAVPSPLPRP